MFAVMLAIGSHGLLDTLGEGGRAIPLFWPLSEHRFIAPWRCLPDAHRAAMDSNLLHPPGIL